MWSTIANFKDNLTQIASDVLDQNDELKADGSLEDDFDELYNPQQESYSYKESDLKAELEWYRAELPRLQAADSELQSTCSNYVSLLKEREDELLRIREENGVLKGKIVAIASEKSSQAHVVRNEVKQLREKLENLELKSRNDEDLHQNQISELQDYHKKERENLMARHKDELAHASTSHETRHSSVENNLQPNSNGPLPPSFQDKQLQELNAEVLQLRQNEEELSRNLLEKDEIYGKLRTAYDRSLYESRRLEEDISKTKDVLQEKDSQLQRHHEAREASGRECEVLRLENLKISEKLCELQKVLDDQDTTSGESMKKLQLTISNLEKSHAELREERDGLSKQLQDFTHEALQKAATQAEIISEADLQALKESATEIDRLLVQVKDAEEAYSNQKREFEKKLDKVSAERDKSIRDLARLKQHLLDKERADSEKMDQDSEEMADLQARADVCLARALKAEQDLAVTIGDLREARKYGTEGLSRATEEIGVLQQKLSSCMAALESKDVELSNLQSALGQYYAESEAQDRFYLELTAVKEESSKLSQQLQIANQKIDAKTEEQDATLKKLTIGEQKLLEKQQKMQKLEDEILRLRRALEQSMTRLNTLSSDSDHNVDRRIVIKLLVTYFQRNHSKEVLDLMVRMLGFSEEDKRRVGLAQQAAGRGVVRGVLGLPGRFVGGIIGSASSDSLARPAPAENKSFADLWIDFLLKESEERERREKAEANGRVEGDGQSFEGSSSSRQTLQDSPGYMPGMSAKGSMSTPQSPSFHRPSSSFSSFSSALPSPTNPPYKDTSSRMPGSTNGKVLVSQGSDGAMEFSSIPLNSTSANHINAKLPPRF